MDHGDARDGKLLESTVVLSFVGVVVPEVAVAAAAVAVLGLADCRDEALYECSRQDARESSTQLMRHARRAASSSTLLPLVVVVAAVAVADDDVPDAINLLAVGRRRRTRLFALARRSSS